MNVAVAKQSQVTFGRIGPSTFQSTTTHNQDVPLLAINIIAHLIDLTFANTLSIIHSYTLFKLSVIENIEI